MIARIPAAPPLPALSVDIVEAEKLAGVSMSTLRRAIAAGELRAVRIGRAVRLRPVDLDDYLRRKAGSDVPAIVPASVEIEGRP